MTTPVWHTLSAEDAAAALRTDVVRGLDSTDAAERLVKHGPNALPQAKLGVYMGLFNIFIVLPQLIVSSVMGQVVRTFFPGDAVWAMLIAAGVMGVAALAMLRVPRNA